MDGVGKANVEGRTWIKGVDMIPAVYKVRQIRSIDELIDFIKWLTNMRREWTAKTVSDGWEVEYEHSENDVE